MFSKIMNKKTQKVDLHGHLTERKNNPYSAKSIFNIAKKRLGEGGIFGIADSR